MISPMRADVLRVVMTALVQITKVICSGNRCAGVHNLDPGRQ